MSNNPTWPAGVGRITLARVDSTMAEAARRADGQSGPVWVMAAEQTAARGRRGRAWAFPRGNFAATLALPLQAPPAQIALRSFVAALALKDAVAALAPGAALAQKWPNDVLLNGGKLAGILLEHPRPGLLLIGVGVNLIAVPPPEALEPHALHPVSLLGETGATVSPADLLDRLAPAFHAWEGRLRADGFAPIRAAWLAEAARLGAPITARTGTEVLHGTFETVDADGHLVLGLEDGPRHIAAAEVHL